MKRWPKSGDSKCRFLKISIICRKKIKDAFHHLSTKMSPYLSWRTYSSFEYQNEPLFIMKNFNESFIWKKAPKEQCRRKQWNSFEKKKYVNISIISPNDWTNEDVSSAKPKSIKYEFSVWQINKKIIQICHQSRFNLQNEWQKLFLQASQTTCS